MTRIVTVLQARRASTRLPGKIFLPLAGEPLLVRMAHRVQCAKLVGRVVVATTTDEGDDATESLCNRYGLACFRGHPADLLDRHYQCAREHRADVVLKIPSDCPLIDASVIDRVITCFQESNADYVSNLHPATYPDGQDVEVMTFAALRAAWEAATRDFEREHTTPYIWERPDVFRLANVAWETGCDYSMTHRLTIDYAEDYELIRRVYEELFPHKPEFDLADMMQLFDQRPELLAINGRYAGVNWYRHHLGELKTIQPNQTRQI